MDPMLTNLQRLLVRELEGFQREVALFPDDESLWRTAPGVTNSAGNLAVHVCGNLQHYIGRVLGGTPYRRDRPSEFSRRSGTRDEVTQALAVTIEMVNHVVPALDPRRLVAPFPEPVMGVQLETGLFLMHLSAHIAFHLGQAGYLRRLLTGQERSSGPLPIKPLGDR